MRIAGVLGLLFALVFGIIAFTPIIDLQSAASSSTSGGIKALLDQFPTFWMLLIALVGLIALMGAAIHMTNS